MPLTHIQNNEVKLYRWATTNVGDLEVADVGSQFGGGSYGYSTEVIRQPDEKVNIEYIIFLSLCISAL